jgi:ribosomal protein L17
MKFTKSELVNIIKEELAHFNEIETKASAAKMAQRIIDTMIKQKQGVFEALAKNPVAARQVVGYLADILGVDLTDTSDQRAVGVQAKRMGVGAAPQEQPK